MNIEDGQLIGKNTPIMNEEEIKKAINSLKKLMEYDVDNGNSDVEKFSTKTSKTERKK